MNAPYAMLHPKEAFAKEREKASILRDAFHSFIILLPFLILMILTGSMGGLPGRGNNILVVPSLFAIGIMLMQFMYAVFVHAIAQYFKGTGKFKEAYHFTTQAFPMVLALLVILFIGAYVLVPILFGRMAAYTQASSTVLVFLPLLATAAVAWYYFMLMVREVYGLTQTKSALAAALSMAILVGLYFTLFAFSYALGTQGVLFR